MTWNFAFFRLYTSYRVLLAMLTCVSCTLPLLCCAVLCCAVLCCAVLCCAVLCCAVLCCAVLCCAVLCCVVLCCVVQIINYHNSTIYKCKNTVVQVDADSIVCYVNNSVVHIRSARLTNRGPPKLDEVCKISLCNVIRVLKHVTILCIFKRNHCK